MAEYIDDVRMGPFRRHIWGPPHVGPGPSGLDPHPSPWDTAAPAFPVEAVSYIVDIVSVKEVALQVKGPLQKQLVQSSDAAMADVIDFVCGNGRHPGPPHWPFPWAAPWVGPVVSALVQYANTLQDGSMRRELIGVGTRIVEQANGARVGSASSV